MPIYSDYDSFNTFSFLDDDGSRTVPGELPPDEGPKPNDGSPLDNPNLRSYWWERFTDITNPDPLGPIGRPMTDDEIAAQWAFNGGNPLDLPLQNLSNQFRTSYESQQMYNQWQADIKQANYEKWVAEGANMDAAQIADPQARAEFVAKMQQYLNSHLTDQEAYDAAKTIFNNSVKIANNTGVNPTGSTDWAGVSGAESGDPRLSGSVTITDRNDPVAYVVDNLSQPVDFQRLISLANLRTIDTPPSQASADIPVGTIDLSKKPDGMSYSEYVFRVAVERALTKAGKTLSAVDFENVIQAYALKGFPMYFGGNRVDEAFLLKMVAGGNFNLRNVVIEQDNVNGILEGAGYNAQTLQRTVASVEVNAGAGDIIQSGGTISTQISPRPLMMLDSGATMFGGTAVVTYPGAIGTGLTAAAAQRLATAVETARTLASSGAISPALLGIVEAAAVGPGAAGLMLGAGYYALFDFIITRAQQIAADDARKLALLNETTLLWQEVARREMLSEAARLAILNVTANQPKTGWSIPSDWDLPEGALVPIAPTGMQPINPNEPGGAPNPIPPIIGLVTATIGVLIDRLSQSQRDELHEAGHTLPSQAPDPNREPTGKPASETDDGKIRENVTVRALARAGYIAEQTPVLTEQDYLDNPWMDRNKERDIRLEGRIFDVYSPSTANRVTLRDQIAEKVVLNQARRIVVNMDYTPVTLEELKQVLLDNPITNLEEIIIFKGGQVILFYPFK